MNRINHGVTRREFIGRSAALAAPLFVSRSALGTQDRAPATSRLGIGFIGMGVMNYNHLKRFLGYPDVQVVAVCDVDPSRREFARKTVEDKYSKAGDASYKGCAAFSDDRELLQRKDIDAVVIATPEHWHALEIITACKAGKDVYCEKPPTLTVHEARLIIEAVRKHGRVFQTGSQQRSEGPFRQAVEYARSGRLGKLSEITIDVGGPADWCNLPEEPLEPGLDWDRWLGPAPKRPYNSTLSPRGVHHHWARWRDYREYCGGDTTDWGHHHFDIAQWALDMDQSGPVEIVPPEDPKAGTGGRLVYAGGVHVVHVGKGLTRRGGGIVFKGSEGQIYVDRSKIRSTPDTILKEPLADKDVHLYRSPGHHRDWLDCIRSRKLPVCHEEIGARSVTACHLLNLAYWNARKLRWDPQAWQFVGDAEANKWLDREHREPYTLPAI